MGRALIIIVVGFTTIFSSMMFNMTSSQQTAANTLGDDYERWLRRNATESVTNVALSKAYRGELPDDTLSFKGATSIIKTIDVAVDSVLKPIQFAVRVVTSYADQSDSTYAWMMVPAYSYYYYMVGTWPTYFTYSTGDTAYGPVHANGQIEISGNPVFMGRVSSTEPNGFNGSGTPKTNGGAEFGVSTIAIPEAGALTALRNAGSSGHYIADSVRILFKADSTYDYTTLGPGPALIGNQKISDHNGIIWNPSGHEIYISGIVAGKVTIVSGKDIIIENDLICKTNPRTYSGSQDYIGLIAEENVEFNYPLLNKNLVVHASIIATNSVVGAGKLQIRNDLHPVGNLALTIVGSLVARRDEVSLNEMLGFKVNNTLYRTHYYDSRLKSNTAPYFPRISNRFEPLMTGFGVN